MATPTPEQKRLFNGGGVSEATQAIRRLHAERAREKAAARKPTPCSTAERLAVCAGPCGRDGADRFCCPASGLCRDCRQ